MKAKITFFIFSILVCQLAGLLGSVFTTPAIPTWYAKLKKPSFNPPNWVFAPVWTTLYFLMGVSLYLVLDKGFEKKTTKIAIGIFAIQLIFNIFWSFLFFKLKSPLFAFLEIVFLWLAILLTIVSFYKISKTAGFLLLPYILWVSFAAFLNFYIFRLN